MTPETRAKARPLIEAALRRGLPTHTADDILDACETGDMQLWCCGESVLVTEIVAFPRATVVRSVVAGGRLRDILTVLPAAEEWARERGCRYAIAGGRRGWGRALGYGSKAVEFVKELNDA